MRRPIAMLRRLFRLLTGAHFDIRHEHCEGCEGISGLPPVTRMGYCAECATVACDAAEGHRVGLPTPADIGAALLVLAAHQCADEHLDNPERCPVCAFGTASCQECGQSMDDLGTSMYLEHRITDENWVAIGCEGYIQPIVRAAWAHAGHRA